MKIIILAFCLVLCSCDYQPFDNLLSRVNKIYTSDVDIKYEAGEKCVYFKDVRFTGRVHSLDESCFMNIKNGVAISAVGLHPNGNRLFEADFTYDKKIIWIYNDEGDGLIKAVYDGNNWNYYDRQNPDENNHIPWISVHECDKKLREYGISLLKIQSRFEKLPQIDRNLILLEKTETTKFRRAKVNAEVFYYTSTPYGLNHTGYYKDTGKKEVINILIYSNGDMKVNNFMSTLKNDQVWSSDFYGYEYECRDEDTVWAWNTEDIIVEPPFEY